MATTEILFMFVVIDVQSPETRQLRDDQSNVQLLNGHLIWWTEHARKDTTTQGQRGEIQI